MDNSQNNRKNSALSTVLAFVLIIILLLFSVLGLFTLGRWVIKLLENLSKIDAVVIVALITGAISLIVTIISKVIDYKNTRKQYLVQKREEPYEEFIAMVYKVIINIDKPDDYTKEQMLTDIQAFSEKLTLWGSKKVAEKWVNFRLNSNKANSPDSKENLFILEDILNEMRSDMGVKKLKKGTLLSFFVDDLNNNN